MGRWLDAHWGYLAAPGSFPQAPPWAQGGLSTGRNLGPLETGSALPPPPCGATGTPPSRQARPSPPRPLFRTNVQTIVLAVGASGRRLARAGAGGDQCRPEVVRRCAARKAVCKNRNFRAPVAGGRGGRLPAPTLVVPSLHRPPGRERQREGGRQHQQAHGEIHARPVPDAGFDAQDKSAKEAGRRTVPAAILPAPRSTAIGRRPAPAPAP